MKPFAPNLIWFPPILSIECKEPDGVHTRQVRPLANDSATAHYLFAKLHGLPSMFSNTPLLSVDKVLEGIDKGLILFLVDQVGILAIRDIQSPLSAEVHMTFWDKRLRGREQLAIEMCNFMHKKADVAILWTAMPSTSKSSLAFAKRIGFRVQNWEIGATFDCKGQPDDRVTLVRMDYFSG